MPRVLPRVCCLVLAVLVTSTASCSHGTDSPSSPSSPTPSAVPEIRGAYTFALQLPATCSPPVKNFSWPVVAEVNSSGNGRTNGTLSFPRDQFGFVARWLLQTDPAATRLTRDTPGPGFDGLFQVGLLSNLAAGPPTRSSDGRGEIVSAQYFGSIIVTLWNTNGTIANSWDLCSMATWSLRSR